MTIQIIQNNEAEVRGNILSFKVLREYCKEREKDFKNSKGEIVSKTPWEPMDWYIALVGEIGEYANFAKKYFRGDIDKDYFIEEAKKELGDIQTYLVLLADSYNVTLRSDRPYLPEYIFSAFRPNKYSSEFKKVALCKLNASLFKLSSSTYEFKTFRLLDSDPSSSRVHANFRLIQYWLEVLAHCCEVDLAEATFNKWNFVSKRAGSSVFIPETELCTVKFKFGFLD